MRTLSVATMLLAAALLAGCIPGGTQHADAVSDLRWLADEVRAADGLHHHALDYEGAWERGFRIPAGTGPNDGFRTTFSLPVGHYRYKVYYQNCSYKFPETDPRSEDNFYGSWIDSGIGFKVSEGGAVEDRISIQGDPRDEDRFVVDGQRHRQARNPRVGRYRFMLVVVDEEAWGRGVVPEHMADLRKRHKGRYVDPFSYFLHGTGGNMAGVEVHVSPALLALSASPDPLLGVHIEQKNGPESRTTGSYCAADDVLALRAAWQPHIHHISEASRFLNIPLVADMDTFSYRDFAFHRAFTPRDAMLLSAPEVPADPCAVIEVDSMQRSLVLRNPPADPRAPRKQSVGIRTRHAFTYGRYRVQCILPRLLNDHDIWNGITNAIWLIDAGGPGAERSPCAGGYLANYAGGADDQRVSRTTYAEIDFEILKTAPYCPPNAFPPNYAQPVADPKDTAAWLTPLPPDMQALAGQVMVSCTNWDMACPDPKRFAVGCHPVIYNGDTFWSFRWDHWYRAVTQKVSAMDAGIFGTPYWFEIDWRPQEITWRIGPDTAHMRVVGHMDATSTTIPDVPMQFIVSQEYHDTEWWPGSPYEQRFIPFLAKATEGRVLQLIID